VGVVGRLAQQLYDPVELIAVQLVEGAAERVLEGLL
jgi:hypothetical protein